MADLDLDAAFDSLLADANKEDESDRKERRKKRKKEDKEKEEKEKKVKEEVEEKKPDAPKMIEIICNDRTGTRVHVKCRADDTIGDVKKIIAAQSGHRADKVQFLHLLVFHFTHADRYRYAFRSGILFIRIIYDFLIMRFMMACRWNCITTRDYVRAYH